MTFAEIKAWLDEHADDQEVKDYQAGFTKQTPLTLSGVRNYLESTDEGKELLTRLTDRAVTNAIETWKTKNLERLVKEYHDKQYPAEDERDRRIRELEDKVNKSERDRERERIRNAAIIKMGEKGLPVEFVDRFIGDDEATTNTYIDEFEAEFKAQIDAIVESEVERRFKDAGKDPHKRDLPNAQEENPWKQDSWNLTKQGQITRDDPEKAKKLKAEAGIKEKTK